MSAAARFDLPWEGVYVEVDAAKPTTTWTAQFQGERQYPTGTRAAFVHVMSRHAGGEIRGYVLIDGKLHLRHPCYTGRWPEMDEAVEAAIGASVQPYCVCDNAPTLPHVPVCPRAPGVSADLEVST